MSINIAEKLATREAYNRALQQENKRSDIELLANALGARMMQEYFDTDATGHFRIKQGCAFVACDMKKRIVTTYYIHGFTPSHNQSLLSLAVSEPRLFATNVSDLSWLSVDLNGDCAVMSNREIDITMAITTPPHRHRHINVQIVGAIALHIAVDGKQLYLIKNIDKIDATTIH